MSKLIKVVGLLFLPVALLVFVLSMINSRSGRNEKGLFVQEFDEQNIYG